MHKESDELKRNELMNEAAGVWDEPRFQNNGQRRNSPAAICCSADEEEERVNRNRSCFICTLEIIWGFVVEAGITANFLRKFLVENTIFRRHFGLHRSIGHMINLNIRWYQTQLLPWYLAYAYVTPSLHTSFSDISIRKWKRFLFLMVMVMPMFISLPVYTACGYSYVAV